MSLTIHGARHFLGLIGNITQPLEWMWIALSQEEIGYVATGDSLAEPTAASYARVQIGNTSGSWSLVGTTLHSQESIIFPEAEEDWGLVRAWAVCDSNLSGNVLIEGTFESPIQILQGDTLAIPPTGLSVSFDIDRWVL